MPQPEDTASPGERLRDLCRPVVAHHPAALDSLAVEPGDSTAEKADHRRFLLVWHHLDVRQPRGVIDGDMNLVLTDAGGAAFLAITRDSIADLAQASQRLDVDVDQVSGPLPFVPLNCWFPV